MLHNQILSQPVNNCGTLANYLTSKCLSLLDYKIGNSNYLYLLVLQIMINKELLDQHLA